MKRFSEWCTKAKLAIVEVASLIGFLGIVAVGLYFEVHTLIVFLHK